MALFEQAKYPERIRVGIVDQIDLDEDYDCIEPEKSCDEGPDQTLCKYKHQIDVYVMDAQLAVGPVFARHIGDRMYRGEYFKLQSDAHMEFVNDWVSYIVRLLSMDLWIKSRYLFLMNDCLVVIIRMWTSLPNGNRQKMKWLY
jgi:hypothetical protein